jgi:hypothetical protein
MRHEIGEAKKEMSAQSEEIEFAASRAGELEEMLLESQTRCRAAEDEVNALREQLAAEQDGYSEQVAELRDAVHAARDQLRERDRKLRQLHDEMEGMGQPKLVSMPSTPNVLETAENTEASLSSELSEKEDNSKIDYTEDVAKALNLLHGSSDFPTLTAGEQHSSLQRHSTTVVTLDVFLFSQNPHRILQCPVTQTLSFFLNCMFLSSLVSPSCCRLLNHSARCPCSVHALAVPALACSHSNPVAPPPPPTHTHTRHHHHHHTISCCFSLTHRTTNPPHHITLPTHSTRHGLAGHGRARAVGDAGPRDHHGAGGAQPQERVTTSRDQLSSTAAAHCSSHENHTVARAGSSAPVKVSQSAYCFLCFFLPEKSITTSHVCYHCHCCVLFAFFSFL